MNLSKANSQKSDAFAHIDVHDKSFKLCNCRSKPTSELHDPKYSTARTKTEATADSVIVTFMTDEVQNKLNAAHSVTIPEDVFNRLDLKFVPASPRIFISEFCVKVSDDLTGKTADILNPACD